MTANRIVVALLLTVGCGAAAAHGFTGTVTHVTDGDTLWVRPDDAARPSLKLRLQGIDAPERCQSWGAEARAALEARVLHRRVEVDTRGHDDYRRSLARVRVAGEDLGAWMVAEGHAWSYRWGSSAGPYRAQERQAREARRGLFADARAVEPRTFRKRFGACP